MLLSICIPIYQRKVDTLVEQLMREIQHNALPAEIVLFDDCSAVEIKNHNRNLSNEAENITYVESTINMGRSVARNACAEAAKGKYLLFIDCDSEIIKDNFLQNYINVIEFKQEVIVGASTYAQEKPRKKYQLRWYIGNTIEQKPAAERNKKPYNSFTSNNFLIEKELFASIQFDTRIKQYGHEDTLFGLQLKAKQAPIKHIDNQVLNAKLDSNTVFLAKTKTALSTLLQVSQLENVPFDVSQEITLLRFYKKYETLLTTLKPITLVFLPILEKLVLANPTSVTLFNLYKLIYFSTLPSTI
ncbi:MAG: glycosyltransferase family 2 protein [Luteibaculaceae bacterium]